MSDQTPEFPPERLSALRGQSVWVTGSRGLIGTELIELLDASGSRVTAFSGDVASAEDVRASLEQARPDSIVNLAAPVDMRPDPSLIPLMDRTVVEGLRTILDAAEELGTRPLVLHVGTCEEYGPIPAPFREEAQPGQATSPYAHAKLQATGEALARSAQGRVDCVVARPFLTYGARQRGPRLIPSAILAALEGRPFEMTLGTQTREFNHVSDTAFDLASLLLCPAAVGRVVNVCCGEERRIIDVVRRIFELAGAPVDLIRAGARAERPTEIRRLFGDPSLNRELLGTRTRRSLDSGLRRTIEAVRQQSPGREGER